MKRFGILVLVFVFFSCLRLDDLLFAPSTVSEYKLNNIAAEDLLIPKDYLVDSNKIYLFTLNSKNEANETETIYGTYLGDTSRIKQDTVFIYCHGNAGNMDYYWQRATLLANIGSKNRFGVFIFDYQGYGKSSGKSTERGLYNDAETCLKWLKEKGLTKERCIFYGYSMGTAPATKLCTQSQHIKAGRLILESPFASAYQLASDATPLSVPGSYATSLYINNAEEIKKVSQPFFWLHGEMDHFLSRKEHGQIVYDNYKGTFKDKFIVSDADHGDVPDKMGYELYLKTLEVFLVK